MEFFKLLVAGFIGGGVSLITPLIQNLVSKRNRKKSIKYDTIENIYVIYDLTKSQVINTTWFHYFSKAYDLKRAELGNLHAILQPEMKDQNLKDLDILLEQSQRQYEVFRGNARNLTNLEAKIYSQLYEIKDTFGHRDFQSVKSLVKKEFDSFHNPEFYKLIDFKNMSREQFDQLNVENKLEEEAKSFDKKRDSIIHEINSVLNKA